MNQKIKTRQRYYQDKPPQIPFFVFVLEVTEQAIRAQSVHQICQTIRSLLPYVLGHKAEVAIITFDEVVHFYHFTSADGPAAMVVQTDIDDPFSACSPASLFLDPQVYLEEWCACIAL